MSQFVNKVLLFSLKTWFLIVAFVFPMIIGMQVYQTYNLGIVTRFNLFFVFLFLSMAVIYFLGRHFNLNDRPLLHLEDYQWRTAFDGVVWLKKHETVAASLLMIGILVVFVPAMLLWSWMMHLGLITSDLSAFVDLLVVVMPFFIVPLIFASSFYESIINPLHASKDQKLQLFNEFHALDEPSGEDLEKLRKTTWILPNRKTKILMGICLLMVIAIFGTMELIELGTLPTTILSIIAYIMIFPMALIIIALFVGDKKNGLEMWHSPQYVTPLISRQQMIMFAQNVDKEVKKIATKINETGFYKIFLIIAAILGFLISILHLLGLI